MTTRADRRLRQYGYRDLSELVILGSLGRLVPEPSIGKLTLVRPDLPDVRGSARGLHHCLEFAADLIVQQLQEERRRDR